MVDETSSASTQIGPGSRPRLPRSVKLRHDTSRNRWVVLAPEKVFSPNDVALEILKLCDGSRDVAAVAEELAKTYDAPKEQILAQVLVLLRDLADKGVVTV